MMFAISQRLSNECFALTGVTSFSEISCSGFTVRADGFSCGNDPILPVDEVEEPDVEVFAVYSLKNNT
jgi:hypothetical protein